MSRPYGVESFWYKEVHEEPILVVMDATMRGERVYPVARASGIVIPEE